MDRWRLDEALYRIRLPSTPGVVGRKFILRYEEGDGSWGVVAGTIVAIGLMESGGEDLVTLHVSAPRLPTAADDEIIHYLLSGSNEHWDIIVDPERTPWPTGTLELL